MTLATAPLRDQVVLRDMHLARRLPSSCSRPSFLQPQLRIRCWTSTIKLCLEREVGLELALPIPDLVHAWADHSPGSSSPPRHSHNRPGRTRVEKDSLVSVRAAAVPARNQAPISPSHLLQWSRPGRQHPADLGMLQIGTANPRDQVPVSREPCSAPIRSLLDTRSTATPINPPRRFTTSGNRCTARISPQLPSPNLGQFPGKVPMVRRRRTRDTARLRLLSILRTSTDQSVVLPHILLKPSMPVSKRHHQRLTIRLSRKPACTAKLR